MRHRAGSARRLGRIAARLLEGPLQSGGSSATVELGPGTLGRGRIKPGRAAHDFAGFEAPGADSYGVDLLPLLPGQHHLLCRGREHAPGDDDRRVNVETADGPQWDGTWAHQSTQGLVWSLLSEIRSQGVWSKDKAWVELSDEQNVGGAWLRRQDDPRATFEEMWDRAYNTGPKLSFQQLVTVLVGIVEDQPGIQLVYLREAAARHGWRNRGDLDDLLAGLIGQGVLRDERTYGPSGKRCTSRRFWKKAVECAGVVAKTAAVTLSLALLAVGSTIRDRTGGPGRALKRLGRRPRPTVSWPRWTGR